MTSSNDIPVLRDPVSKKSGLELDPELIENLRARLSADMRTLVDEVLAEALADAQENLRLIVNDRLSEELPDLIEQALKARLGEPKAD
jgi:hypothetical protein